MYELNRYGKIVVDEKEVYYGCITDLDSKMGIVKLFVVDWRDRELPQHSFNQMVVPISKFTIKYLDVVQ
jgi:hypothetical protein